jgi:hypothetical protein
MFLLALVLVLLMAPPAAATDVLRPARVLSAPPPGAAGTVRYEGAARVRPGSFVAAGVGPATPEGLLARVVSVRRGAGETAVSVVPADLFEAVPAGSIELAPAVDGALAPRRRRFRAALGCGPGVEASVSGSLAVAVRPRLKLRWSPGGLEAASARVTVTGDASLSGRIAAAGWCSLGETAVARWDGPPLRLSVGPVPVVIVPRTTLYVAAEAVAGAALEAGIRGHVSATAGLRYDGAVHPVGSFAQHLSHTVQEARVTGELGARVIPSVTLLLYGRAGPRFDLAAGLQLDAHADGDPWWTLTAPVELSAGFEVPGLADLSIPQQTVLSRSLPLAQAERDRDSVSAAGTERARVTWDTDATDVDLHVWDEAGHHAWFMAPKGVPGGELAEDDRYGFGPEHFLDSADGRTLTYGLCYFDDAGGVATMVTARIADPGGGVRQFKRTLASDGDHVLLGSSPPGSGFTPAEGWCNP